MFKNYWGLCDKIVFKQNKNLKIHATKNSHFVNFTKINKEMVSSQQTNQYNF